MESKVTGGTREIPPSAGESAEFRDDVGEPNEGTGYFGRDYLPEVFRAPAKPA